MTESDLPANLRNLGGQPFTGEKVTVLLTEKQWSNLLPLLLERENEKSKKESA